MFSRYIALLEKSPIKTKAASAVVLFSISDIIAQAYEYAEKDQTWSVQRNYFEDKPISGFYNDYSPRRTLRIAAFGCAITVWLHGWWGFLETFVEKRVISASLSHYKNAAVKVFFDQSIGAPIYNIGFFGSQAVLGGKTLYHACEDIIERVPPTLALHYCFWPWVHLINFSFFPLHSRILVQNTLLIGWMAFLSNREQNYNSVEEISTPEGVKEDA